MSPVEYIKYEFDHLSSASERSTNDWEPRTSLFTHSSPFFQPPYAFISLILYYFCAETWFAILFTVIIEVCPPEVKSGMIGLFLFIMNNVGGNLPVIVDPLAKSMGYREAIYFIWPGCVALSSVMFFLASIPLWRQARQSELWFLCIRIKCQAPVHSHRAFHRWILIWVNKVWSATFWRFIKYTREWRRGSKHIARVVSRISVCIATKI